MAKRKEDVSAKTLKHELDHTHHEAWLANIVALVTVLVFAVYVLMTREQMDRMVQQMAQRLAAVEVQCSQR
jgi:hypothetical protein